MELLIISWIMENVTLDFFKAWFGVLFFLIQGSRRARVICLSFQGQIRAASCRSTETGPGTSRSDLRVWEMTGTPHPVVKTSTFMRFPHFMCEWEKALLLQCHEDYPLGISLSFGPQFISCLCQTSFWLEPRVPDFYVSGVFLIDAPLSLTNIVIQIFN